MSAKIPVGQVIGQTYRFAFGRYPTLLGIVWLPAVVMLAMGYFVWVPMMANFSHFAQEQAQHIGQPGMAPVMMPNMGLFWLGELVLLLVYIWIGVGVSKEVLGLRTGSRFFYLPGVDELRVAGATILVIVISYAAMFAVVLVAVVIGIVGALAFGASGANWDRAGMDHMAGPAIAAIIVLAAFVYIALIYVMIRLIHLVVPATIAEKRIAVTRGWHLMKGNVLRAFVIAIVTSLPLIALELVVFIAFIAPVFPLMLAPHKPQPDDAVFTAMTQAWMHYMPAYLLLGLLIAPIVAGLIGSPASFAWRALVPPPPVVPPQIPVGSVP